MSGNQTTRPKCKPRGRPFTAGSGNRGRPKGIPNKATLEIREIAQRLIGDPGYLESLRERLLAGRAGMLEPLLFAYAFGRPKEIAEPVEAKPAETETEADLSKLTYGELVWMRYCHLRARGLPIPNGDIPREALLPPERPPDYPRNISTPVTVMPHQEGSE